MTSGIPTDHPGIPVGERARAAARWILPYAVATVATIVTLLIRRALGGVTAEEPALEIFLIGIALSAYLGGLYPGFYAAALSLACAGFYLLPARTEAFTMLDALEWVLMPGAGIFVSLLMHRLRTSQESLRASEQRLGAVIASATDGIITLDGAGRVTGFNPAAERAFGRPASLVLGQPASALLPERARAPFMERLRQNGGGDPTTHLGASAGLFALRADGSEFPIEVSLAHVQVAGKPMFTAIVRDITERRRAEMALRESERTLRLFIEHAPAAIAMFDRAMRYVVASRRWVTDYRLEDADLIGRCHYDVFPEISSRWKEIHRRCLEGAVESCDEDPFVRLDGRIDWIKWEVRPWTDASGSIGGIIVMSESVSARHHAAEAVRESESRFRQLAEGLPQLVWTCRPDGPCDYLSPQWVAYTGIPEKEQLGFAWLNQIHPDDRGPAIGAWRASAEEGRTFHFEYRIRRHDGVYGWFDGRAVPLRDEAGRIVRWFGSSTDITERKRTDETLRFQGTVLREMGAIARVGGWTFDVRTGEGYWTEEVARIHDVDPESTTNRDFGLSFYEGESRARMEAALQEAVDRGVPYDLELELISAKGVRKWVRTIGHPVVEGGVVTRLHGSFQDITDRRRIEQEIRDLNTQLEQRVQARTAQLEAANRELEAFSYSVSHDLRAPLRTIDGFSDALLVDFGAGLPPEAARYLHLIRQGAQRMGQLIDDLLTFSRLSRQPLRQTQIDMHALVADTLSDLQPLQSGRNVEVREEALLPCQGDRALLKQVWMNLLSNALKYTRDREPARIELGSRATADGITYSVCDNGAGFDMQYASKLFQVFQRLHSQDEYEGTGVGLAIVHRIVTRHGGRVWCEATPNRGACFYFTVPAPGTIPP